jgi:hypothetical protein
MATIQAFLRIRQPSRTHHSSITRPVSSQQASAPCVSSTARFDWAFSTLPRSGPVVLRLRFTLMTLTFRQCYPSPGFRNNVLYLELLGYSPLRFIKYYYPEYPQGGCANSAQVC